MKEQEKSVSVDSLKKLLIDMEKSVLEAFKNKQDETFTQNFADNYIGVANDGIKNAEGEIAGMHRLDLQDLRMTDEKIMLPAENVAILTYKMLVQGNLGEKDISGAIYTSTVYVNQEDKWLAFLHTESLAQ